MRRCRVSQHHSTNNKTAGQPKARGAQPRESPAPHAFSYIKSLPKQSQTAMEQCESALCAERAQKTEPQPAGRLLN